MNTVKIAKAVLGIAVVLVLFLIVANWWGDYRGAAAGAKAGKGSTATSSTVTGGTSVSPESGMGNDSGATAGGTDAPPQVLIVSVDGLNFREQPDGQSKAIRGLSKGERVTLVATQGDWYKVEDSKGVIGYITSNPTYTEKPK